MIRRVYVEKKDGFDVRARGLEAELAAALGIKTSVRIFLRYDAEIAENDDFNRAVERVFSEPMVDKTYAELPAEIKSQRLLCVEFLPGQFDARAESAAQCVSMLTMREKPAIRCATLYAFQNVSEADFARIKAHLINPVESREAAFELPKTLVQAHENPPAEQCVSGFISMDEKALSDFYKANSFAFTLADLRFIQSYFKGEKREPFQTELKILDTYWSDHCRHTTFNTHLNEIKIESKIPEIGEAFKEYERLFNKHHKNKPHKYHSLMDMATMGARELDLQGCLKNLDKSDEINACSIKVKAEIETPCGAKQEDWIVMFKNETHNHPTEIEPYGGAATCLGGAIRDPLSGRVLVYQSMRVSGAANINAPLKDTLKGKLPQRVISKGAANGFSSYGNQIGLATGHVREFFHPGYAAKRFEAGFVVGAAPAQNIVRKEPSAGDIVLLIGGATGRDGCGGATGSSKAHNADSLASCGAEVQKGDALTERKLQRLFLNPDFSKLIKRCNDFGAGGVSVAVGELSEGCDINLDAIHKKYEGLTGLELAVSESQERMAVVIDPSSLDEILKLCQKENVQAAEVAKITDAKRLRMFWRGQKIADLDRGFLDSAGVKQTASAIIKDNPKVNPKNYFELNQEQKRLFESKNYAELTKKLLSSPNCASQKGLVEMFDSTIGAGTVLMPFGGKNQTTPSIAMVAKLPISAAKQAAGNSGEAAWQTDTVTVAAQGFDPFLSESSPFLGAIYSVAASLIKVVIAGGDLNSVYLTFQEYFERLKNEPERWGKPTAALLGALYAQLKLKKAAIGGKDSMSGSFEGLDVPPTLVSFALGTGSASKIISNAAPSAGLKVYRFRLKKSASFVPDLEYLSAFLQDFEAARNKKQIEFATIAEDGGAISALIKSLLGEGLGFETQTEITEDLFANSFGDIIFGVKDGGARELTAKYSCGLLGETTNSNAFDFGKNSCDLGGLEKAFSGVFEAVFPTSAVQSGEIISKDYFGGAKLSRAARIAKPRVFIPVFPGTNCEFDSAAAFIRAGAEVETFVIKNLSPEGITASVESLKRGIGKSNILMLPGGFSGGDEPDGSGKFIAIALSSAPVKDAINELLQKRDGLILGICNGFQALVKLGLLPFGNLGEVNSNSPTLTFNSIGRHISQICRIRIASNLSPWLNAVKPGEVYNQPFSHGEGRFYAGQTDLKRMLTAGQIAAQYCDFEGNLVMQTPFNPNGSAAAIEAVTSPCGRILGKMGHSERIGKYLYKNVAGDWDLKLFESGVKYFD